MAALEVTNPVTLGYSLLLITFFFNTRY